MKIVLCVALLLCLVVIDAFRPTSLSRSITGRKTSSLKMGVGKEAKRAWTKGDLGEGADMFDDTEDDAMADVKKKFKLEPGQLCTYKHTLTDNFAQRNKQNFISPGASCIPLILSVLVFSFLYAV